MRVLKKELKSKGSLPYTLNKINISQFLELGE